VIVAGRPAVVDPVEPQYTILPGDTVLVPGPMYHQGPFIFSTGGLFVGGKIVVMPHFDPEETLALIERHRVTWTYFVPTMTHRIWRLDKDVREHFDLSSLRIVMSTGAPWAPWLQEEWIRWLGPEKILEGYGGTEEQGGLLITGLEALAHPGSVGKTHDDLRVLDEDGNEVAAGTLGELYFRPPADPQHRTIGADNHDRDGWRSYGDIGHIGEDGYVYLSDRRTDMIVSGGANIYPAEIEGALEAHPLVRSAVVIGLPNDDLGQRVHAIVDVAEHRFVSDDDLRTHLREHMAAYKIPRTFEFVHQPLRDDAGKVRRAALRDRRLVADPATQTRS
jgi:bile acid-coenzyme A ligase